MDSDFSNRKEKKFSGVLSAGVVLILVGVVAIVLYSRSKNSMVSPLPPNPSYEVIFYTPTPQITQEESTPSATPKPGKSSPTPSLKPTVKPSRTPTPPSPSPGS